MTILTVVIAHLTAEFKPESGQLVLLHNFAVRRNVCLC